MNKLWTNYELLCILHSFCRDFCAVFVQFDKKLILVLQNVFPFDIISIVSNETQTQKTEVLIMTTYNNLDSLTTSRRRGKIPTCQFCGGSIPDVRNALHVSIPHQKNGVWGHRECARMLRYHEQTPAWFSKYREKHFENATSNQHMLTLWNVRSVERLGITVFIMRIFLLVVGVCPLLQDD